MTYEVYIDGRHMLPDYGAIDDAASRAVVMSNRAPSSEVEIRLDGETCKAYKGGQELIVEDAPEIPEPENAADVLVDAIYSNPETLTADDINDLFARMELAINGRPKATVLRLIPGGKDEFGEGNGGSYPARDR